MKIFLSLSHAVIKYKQKQKGEESECFNHYVEIVNNIFNVTNTLIRFSALLTSIYIYLLSGMLSTVHLIMSIAHNMASQTCAYLAFILITRKN